MVGRRGARTGVGRGALGTKGQRGGRAEQGVQWPWREALEAGIGAGLRGSGAAG
eukprot:CAMPEP_0198438684 /NCGR_PEP_ID=MMETSP1452-20131203/52103_1 /TAXON_ID=1181717 /ORGANISM="Synchroma pusillum, Strain CCMP3072" /LENGTH=53 /DNA_ID=CAMNT_0044159273 /DNA_START=251 /DNA_END=409 /DNA_ORIENTATION=-